MLSDFSDWKIGGLNLKWLAAVIPAHNNHPG